MIDRSILEILRGKEQRENNRKNDCQAMILEMIEKEPVGTQEQLWTA